MFGTLGGPEIFLILVIALIVFGPRKLPEIGKSMGRMLAEFRKASNDFKRTIALDEHASSALVDHHLRDSRIPEQILDRFQERQDPVEAAHSAPCATCSK